MPPVKVFVSYADTFIGSRVLAQFQQYPTAYTVYGCTWDAAAADRLNEANAATTASPSGALRHTGNSDHALSAAAAAQDEEHDDDDASSLHDDSCRTVTPHSSTRASTAPLPDGVDATGSRPSTPTAASAAQRAAAAAAGFPSPSVHSSCTFFARRNVAAVRAALLMCDWIVLELKQAQTVLEVVQFLQQQPSFERPKRLVLLSSLMTWYATPPLEGGAALDDTQGQTAADEEENGGEGDQDGNGDAEAEAEVEAPYPPPPPQSLEKLLRSAQEAARHAVVDAMRSDRGVAADDAEEDETNNDGAAGGAEEADGAVAGPEVLTEDQYNRRVPHLHYLNWRDAEKAVAAAHHANGLPLDTFVVCGGLPYGGEEDTLEPLFRLAWSARAGDDDDQEQKLGAANTIGNQPSTITATHDPAAIPTLPIFGTGAQRVPLVHVQDLACFVRKILRCPTASLPFPERRYLFATDGTNANSWASIVSSVNRMFGARCALRPVPPESYPLYRDVDRFTMDLRVEAETMKALMERDEDEGIAEGKPASASVVLPNTWIAEGGLRRHLRVVASEFTTARGVTPLRVAIVGPPLSGKTYLARRLARFYRLPCVSQSSVVAEYTAALQALCTRMESTKAAVLQAERTRRLGIKRRRLLLRQQRAWDAGTGGDAAAVAAGEDGGDAAGELNGGAGDEERHNSSGGSDQHPGQGRHGSANDTADGDATTVAATPSIPSEVSAAAMALTQAEEEELSSFVREWWADQPQVRAWADKIAEMKRVLLLRLHPRPPTPDANPKKRAAGGGGGGGGGGKKKQNPGKDAQKSREEEEEVQQLKATLQHAQFQPRAFALMLRWRLAQPDCRVQGFVLDGVPATLELARMVFAEDGDDAVQPPATEEEALRPRYAGEASHGGAGGGGNGDDGADEKGGGADGSGGGGPTTAKEAANDARLPNHVVVLQASDTYLLSRLKAMGTVAAAAAAAAPSSVSSDATHPVDVEAFQSDLQTYKHEYVEVPYSVMSYWECAAAASNVPLAGSRALPKERRAEVHSITVEGNEPLVPPPPPASPYAVPQLGYSEQLLEQVILGRPHHFGKSLDELQRDAVRQRCLQDEAERAVAEQLAAQAAAESNACAQELNVRAEEDERLQALKLADMTELEARKQPLTRYLQERVLPLLHKGLLEVCATRPEDPVDYLAEWLMRHNPHDDIFCDL